MKILPSAKRHEIFCAYTLHDICLISEDYIVGDVDTENLPDIYCADKHHGIEVVQLEKKSDFKLDRIWKLYKQFNGDFKKIKTYCDNHFPNEYILQEFNGKLGSFSVNEGAHSIDWMQDIYKEEINKKIKKLNQGNYAGITKTIDLCVSIIQRRKDEYDAKLVLFSYFDIKDKYKKSFNNIFIITSTEIFIININKVKRITPIYHQNCIVDFSVIGEDYISKINYDYNQIMGKVNEFYKKKEI